MLEEPSAAPARMQAERPGRRCVVYVLLLMVLAAGVFFTNLGGPTMSVDEAQYALCVEHCRQSLDWLGMTPYPPEPYYQKPPMYVWLTGLTYRFFGDGMVRYRFWSAVFGIGCVALTCVWGSMLISAEVGLLGGLLLLTNRYFQSDHGARTGSLDTAVTLCVLVCLVLYWMLRAGRMGRRAWAGIGAAAGLACLFKPIAGVPILGILALHALLVECRSGRLPRPGTGLLMAFAAALAVVSPYYIAVVSRAGGRVFHESIERAIIDTATSGDPNTHEHMFRNSYADPLVERQFSRRPWHWLVTELHHSSPPFLLAGAGAVFAIVMSLRGKNRGAFALLTMLTVVYLFIFSLSAVRRIRYTYPAFPAVALCIAALCVWVLMSALRRARAGPSGPALASAVAACVVGLVLLESLRVGQNQLGGGDRCDYVPWNTYEMLKPAIRDGRLRLVFYGFPQTQLDWRRRMGLDASDCFYLEQMREAVRVADPAELRRLLADKTPTLLLLSKFVDADGLESELKLDDRSDDRFVFEHRAFRLRGIDMDPLLDPRLAFGIHCASIQLLDLGGNPVPIETSESATAPGGFIVRITPPLLEDGWLALRLKKPQDGPNSPERFDAWLGKRLLAWDRIDPSLQEYKITVPIKHGRWSKGINDVVIYLHPAQGSAGASPVIAGVKEVSLSLYPEAAVSP